MKKFKILIVEDESLIALQLELNLAQVGYDICKSAARGEEAIEKVRKEQPDVILMDIRLLGPLDGIEVARQVAAFSSASVIFITGYTDPGVQERALSLNPLAYLIKPIEMQTLETILRSAYPV